METSLSSHSSEMFLTLSVISEILLHWSSLTPKETRPEAIRFGMGRLRAEIGRALASCLALLTLVR